MPGMANVNGAIAFVMQLMEFGQPIFYRPSKTGVCESCGCEHNPITLTLQTFYSRKRTNDLNNLKLFQNLKAEAHPTKIYVGVFHLKKRLKNQKLSVHFYCVKI